MASVTFLVSGFYMQATNKLKVELKRSLSMPTDSAIYVKFGNILPNLERSVAQIYHYMFSPAHTQFKVLVSALLKIQFSPPSWNNHS